MFPQVNRFLDDLEVEENEDEYMPYEDDYDE